MVSFLSSDFLSRMLAAVGMFAAVFACVFQIMMAISYGRRFTPSRKLKTFVGVSIFVMAAIAICYCMITFNILGLSTSRFIGDGVLRILLISLIILTALLSLFSLEQSWAYEKLLDELESRHALLTKEQAEVAELQQAFLQNTSHELRTPLTIIKGFSELIPTVFSDTPPQIAGYLQSINHQANIMEYLIRNITSYLKADRPETVMMAEINLSTLLVLVFDDLNTAVAEPNGVKATATISPNIYMFGHGISIKLICYNLIVNAIKFSPPDKSGGTVHVGLQRVGDEVVLSVSDTGIGISDSFMENLFKPFYQEYYDERRPFAGVGIGLSVVKKLVGLHNGRIEVDSTVGQGSVFKVYFRTTG